MVRRLWPWQGSVVEPSCWQVRGRVPGVVGTSQKAKAATTGWWPM